MRGHFDLHFFGLLASGHCGHTALGLGVAPQISFGAAWPWAKRCSSCSFKLVWLVACRIAGWWHCKQRNCWLATACNPAGRIGFCVVSPQWVGCFAHLESDRPSSASKVWGGAIAVLLSGGHGPLGKGLKGHQTEHSVCSAILGGLRSNEAKPCFVLVATPATGTKASK